MRQSLMKNIFHFQPNNVKRLFVILRCNYSMYPPTFVDPIPIAEEQKKLEETGKNEILKHIPIKAARNYETDSIHYDPLVQKFTNYLMRKGNKALARSLIEKAFENVKRFQLEKYNSETDPLVKESIVIDPLVIFHKAVENSKPALKLTPVKRGGSTYQVPMPITDNQARFMAMNWLIEAGREKDRSARWWIREAHELIDAAEHKGRVVKKKQDLHKQCEANRAYAHYRWG
ncbi:mitochondrial ribosomal protein S7 [Lycorma delicatula]|uniref:mitochondrial ribosomal protein S7 n=1 Tax=Lycorma delicatula TaxID=130591 RepID=UPI003F516F04